MTEKPKHPTVTNRSKRAWQLLRRTKAFFLKCPGKKVYFVSRGGWATPYNFEGPSVHTKTLLDQSKNPYRLR